MNSAPSIQTSPARAAEQPSRLQSLAIAIALSSLFFLVYCSTNWITARHSDVTTCYFPWETNIPLLPAMIIPYMSIDLLFFAAPFLCRQRRELQQHARRVAAAILLCGACFLIFPLRPGFTRAPAGGVYGGIFSFLWSFDQPYNLAPSLHIAFCCILWPLYGRHTTGLSRQVLKLWFILIASSALLTHQHHVIDVFLGCVLGLFCLHIFPESSTAYAPTPTGRHIALRYAAGAAILLLLGYALRPWGILLLWPVLTLSSLAAAYTAIGPSLFHKKNGRAPAATRFFLAPYLIFATASRQFYNRKDHAFCELLPGLLVGRKLNSDEASTLRARGVLAVLDLTAEYSETRGLRGISYLNIPILDLTAPTLEQLTQAVNFLDKHIHSGPIYIHCALGCSRSACIAAAYLLHTTATANVPAALAIVRQFRPKAAFSPEIVAVLHEFFAQSHAARRSPEPTQVRSIDQPQIVLADSPT